jgi:CRP-like cAMP-binding protein
MDSTFCDFTSSDFEKLRAKAVTRCYKGGELIFAQGAVADHVYFIESGQVSIFIDKFNSTEEIHNLGPGQCFGEMALFNRDRRTASAMAKEDTTCMGIAKQDFLQFMQAEPRIAEKVHRGLVLRSEELTLKEKLINATSLCSEHLHISIKGDPSLRESALTRERYQSVVDAILPELVVVLEDLLLNRSAYQLFIGFNSGEVRVSSVLDPFGEEFHPAQRLLDEAYVERHFPPMDYEQKIVFIRDVYHTLANSSLFQQVPTALRQAFEHYYAGWHPVSPVSIATTISQLPVLRSIPNYYVRNATISIIKDAIHMQFNCDGAHIVSAEDYERFLQENL